MTTTAIPKPTVLSVGRLIKLAGYATTRVSAEIHKGFTGNGFRKDELKEIGPKIERECADLGWPGVKVKVIRARNGDAVIEELAYHTPEGVVINLDSLWGR